MLLTLNKVSFSYQQQPVLSKVSFAIEAGQLVGVVGPNGGGKSTLIKLIAKQIAPQRGDICLNGKPLNVYSTKELAQQIAYLPQHPVVPAGITVEQLIQYGRHPHQSWFSQWSNDDAIALHHAIQTMQLEDILMQPVATLSGGQRQRVWLAMVMAQNTPLVLLDEPTSALDIGHQVDVMEAIAKMVAQGKTVVLVIHDLAAAARYCDQLIAIGEHHLVAAGDVADVVTKPLIDRLYQTSVDILQAPYDKAPVIVPRRY